MGDLAALISRKAPPMKYGDPGHPTVTIQVKNVIRETPTILELADRSTIKPEGVIEDLIISVEYWNYPADFFVLQTKTKLGGHPLILGRPWLATTYAFINCRSGSMKISNGSEAKQLTLYPHATPMINNDNSVWLDYDDEDTQPILTIVQALTFKDTIEDEVISNFIYEPSSVPSETYYQLTAILKPETQKNLKSKNLSQTSTDIPSMSITVEIKPGKTLNINPNLTDAETQQLMRVLRENKEAFAWEYTDMKGISPELCTHHIYIKERSQPVCQPQQ
eukprot:PITA_16231